MSTLGGEEPERLLARYDTELEADSGVRGALTRHREATSGPVLRPTAPCWPALMISFVLLALSAGAMIVGRRTGIWALTIAGVVLYPLVIAPLACKSLRPSRQRRRLRGPR